MDGPLITRYVPLNFKTLETSLPESTVSRGTSLLGSYAQPAIIIEQTNPATLKNREITTFTLKTIHQRHQLTYTLPITDVED
ncbi:hypothetical protein EMIT0111MI5_200009 [Burkholderia sp. IT-111MI5]